jgi:hypothetical protein
MEPLRHAVDVLSGVPGAFTLLLGVDGSFEPLRTGCTAIIATSREKVDPSSLRLKQGGHNLLRADGSDFTDAAYIVLAIEAAKTKPDWTRIPELLAANQRVKEALTRSDATNRHMAAKDAMSHFRLTVLTSPDLVFTDARTIVQKAQDRMDMILNVGVAKASAEAAEWPDDLASL